ncbi:hypothetical protein GTY75_24715 [Streptomyces sp. SID8381]|uniref:hypothetical protein n=1 Tax=unclassified Streptomyces TaxID=2593676 RepID=UPI00131A0393|nr:MULTISPECIES: hypothetical protein [unclassified Streptomyces]MYX29795.1 hypothetical protein [Streptomyces sp. SID8381]
MTWALDPGIDGWRMSWRPVAEIPLGGRAPVTPEWTIALVVVGLIAAGFARGIIRSVVQTAREQTPARPDRMRRDARRTG